jgi:hypothetical protein
MALPKFLMADNTEQPDAIYIVHTEYPRFVLNLENDEIEWFDALDNEDEADLEAEVTSLVEQAEAFYQREVDRYERL